MTDDIIIKQLQDITQEYELACKSSMFRDRSDIEVSMATNIISRGKAVIARHGGVNCEYYKDIENSLQERGTIYLKLRKVMGTVYAFKSDVEKGFLKPLYSIIQSEVFSNYLDMAEYLNREGYKDAAAVIAGSTLEAHLKELAKQTSIDLLKPNGAPKAGGSLNDELGKLSAYSASYHKQITAWLSIRNDAAHGDYGKYKQEQVVLMIEGIRQFTLN